MPRPKRHHYVPESYLKGFVDPESDCLHAYDRIRRNYWTPKPHNMMVIRYHNTQKHAPAEVDPDVFEKDLGEWIESKVKSSFSKLLNDPHALTTEDYTNILTYLDLQYIRVPRQIELSKRMLKIGRYRRALQEAFPELGMEESRLAYSDHFRFDFIRMFWGHFAHYFSRMNWEVITAPNPCSFITTDSPVSFYNKAFPPPWEAGIALAGTRVLFPLDAQHALILRHPTYLQDTHENAIEEIFYNESDLAEFNLLYGIVVTEDEVKQFNSAMLQLSDKYVVGKSRIMIEQAIEPGL
jgi:hypothetical protein